MRRRPRILLIEDNVNSGVQIYNDLVRVGQTSWLNSESEFEKYWHLVEAEPPDVVVLDVMMAWAHPSKEKTPIPPGGVPNLYTAGIRCAQKIVKSEKTRNVKIVFYTLVPEEDVREPLKELLEKRPDMIYLQKPFDIGSVVGKVVQLIPDDAPVVH